MGFRSDVINELIAAHPDIPADVLELLQAAPVQEFETNRIRMEIQCPNDPSKTIRWRITAYGKRDHTCQSWSVKKLQLSKGVEDSHDFSCGLPAQTCDWDCNAVPVRWEV